MKILKPTVCLSLAAYPIISKATGSYISKIYLYHYLYFNKTHKPISSPFTMSLNYRLINEPAMVESMACLLESNFKEAINGCSATSNYKIVAFVFMGETERRDHV